MQKNPNGACAFVAIASVCRKPPQHAVVSKKSHVVHSYFCPVAKGKIPSKLLANDPDFAQSCRANGNKATHKALQDQAPKAGFAASADQHTLYRAQRKIRARDNEAWEPQWQELSRYLARLEAADAAYVHVEVDGEDTFRYAFVAFKPMYEALKVHGRPVCSTDFGHFKLDMFGGLNAIGMFQFGDGTLVPLWCAVFADKDESAFMWETCAKHSLHSFRSGLASSVSVGQSIPCVAGLGCSAALSCADVFSNCGVSLSLLRTTSSSSPRR